MNKLRLPVLGMAAVLSAPAFADNDFEALQKQLDAIKQDYESRITELEKRLEKAEQESKQAPQQEPEIQSVSTEDKPAEIVRGKPKGDRSFNPAISLILDGRYSDFSRDPEEYELPGFMLAGEAGPGEQGFALGHNELVISANADDKFYGRFTAVFAEHDGETELEIEEAFFETLGLDYGLKLKGGRFFSDIGYLNSQHPHQWDFTDAPLIYRGLFGNQLNEDGLQLSWVAPTDLYLSFGSEVLRGASYPISADSNDTVGAYTLFAKLGGDVGASNSWQAGISLLDSDVGERTSEAHGHEEHEEEEHEAIAFSGDSKTWGADFVWKWAPNGNRKQRYLQLQAEYFFRDDDGILSEGEEVGTLVGEQSGWYAQAVYQFMPRWRLGLRYDSLDSSATGSDQELIEEAGLDSGGYKPQRWSLMGDWSNSEFSRFRVQYNRDESSPEVDDQWLFQYILSLGSHGAHRY